MISEHNKAVDEGELQIIWVHYTIESVEDSQFFPTRTADFDMFCSDILGQDADEALAMTLLMSVRESRTS